MNKIYFTAGLLLFSYCFNAQKTTNRNLETPFSNTEYISGAFGSVINKDKDSFQIVKDSDNGKYALLFEESEYTSARLNNDTTYNPSAKSIGISRSIIFDNKEDLQKLYLEIENSIKNNIAKKDVEISGRTITISYVKVPLIPGTTNIITTLDDGKKTSSFGLSKNRWKDLFAEL